jgi:hypothetical protein
MAIDLSKAVKVDPAADSGGSPGVVELAPIQKAGFKLAVIVLTIIAVYVIFIISLFLFTNL